MYKIIFKRGMNVENKLDKVSKRKSRLVAFLLCYTFGLLGAHRFYAGKHYTAIIYIFTFGLLAIGTSVDLLKIILGKFKTSKGYLIKNWIEE